MLPFLCYIYLCAHIRTYIILYYTWEDFFQLSCLSLLLKKVIFIMSFGFDFFLLTFFLFYFTISLSLTLLFCGEKKEGRHTLKYCWWIFRFTTYNRLFGWKNIFFSFIRYLDQFLTICCHSQGGWKKRNLCWRAICALKREALWI